MFFRYAKLLLLTFDRGMLIQLFVLKPRSMITAIFRFSLIAEIVDAFSIAKNELMKQSLEHQNVIIS